MTDTYEGVSIYPSTDNTLYDDEPPAERHKGPFTHTLRVAARRG